MAADQAVRKIVPVDMDAFYVAIETRDNPHLLNKPVAVGGKASGRGVIATCNYLARQYGVRSAMPTQRALQQCPTLVLVPPRMELYRQVSQSIQSIFHQYTDFVEPLSLDEAYLDVSHCQHHQGSATRIAEEIRQRISRETGLTASAGIAPLKFLAKIASEKNKPNGQFTIRPQDVEAFIEKLPLKAIPGVGQVTIAKLHQLGLFTGGDVMRSDPQLLNAHFGKFGEILYARCHGIDERPVEITRDRKSIAVERTFPENLDALPLLIEKIREHLLPALIKRYQPMARQVKIVRLGVKVKFSDFRIVTKEQQHSLLDLEVFEGLLKRIHGESNNKSVRLLGLTMGIRASTGMGEQLVLALGHDSLIPAFSGDIGL